MKHSFGGVLSVPVLALALLLAWYRPTPWRSVFPIATRWLPVYPTPETVVDQMLTMAQVRPGEMVYDLGCGDGRIVIAAAQKFKARAVGIEIRRDIYERTLARVASLGLERPGADRARQRAAIRSEPGGCGDLIPSDQLERAAEADAAEGSQALGARRVARLRDSRLEAGDRQQDGGRTAGPTRFISTA